MQIQISSARLTTQITKFSAENQVLFKNSYKYSA